MTVRALTDYVTPDGAMTYQTMKEWYELGDKTEFAVSGCYGDYIKMLMTSIGQDYAPYVFLLTENGNVEYIDVISGHSVAPWSTAVRSSASTELSGLRPARPTMRSTGRVHDRVRRFPR